MKHKHRFLAVLLIVIGPLLWWARVTFIAERQRAQRRACIAHMRNIDSALCSMGIEEPLRLTNITTSADMPPRYFMYPNEVLCPCAHGKPYIINIDLAFLQSTNRPQMNFKGDLIDDTIVILCPAAVQDPVRYRDHSLYDTTNTLTFIEQQHRAAGTNAAGIISLPQRTNEIITVVYGDDPFGTFTISGSDVRGIELEGLKDALVKHQEAHAGVYEVLSEIKAMPERQKEITDAFKAAGVDLVHYWAPVSNIDPKAKPEKHGIGYVDILNSERK